MSRTAEIDLPFAGDQRTFKLDIKNLLALEERCAAGCAEILERLQTGKWRVRDVQEPIRLGLMGAGVEGAQARDLVDDNVGPGALLAHVLIAQAIIMAALAGDDREPVGKEQAATDTTEAAAASPPPPSMEPGPSSDSLPLRPDA